MSIRVCDLVWRYGPRDPTQRFVLLCLADYADETGGKCFPSVKMMAEKCCSSDRTILRALQGLEKYGWIEVQRNVRGGKGSEYQITLNRFEQNSHDILSPDTHDTVSCETSSHDKLSPEPPNSHDILSPDNLSPIQTQVTKTTDSHDILSEPPHPHIGRTVNNRHLSGAKAPEGAGLRKSPRRKSAKAETKTAIAKSRHALFKAAILRYWEARNQGVEMPWDQREGRNLELWLRASPQTTIEQFESMLRNRYRSNVVQTERPSRWIANITSFAAGPLDRFGKPLAANGKPAPPDYPPGFFDDPPVHYDFKPAKPTLLDIANAKGGTH